MRCDLPKVTQLVDRRPCCAVSGRNVSLSRKCGPRAPLHWGGSRPPGTLWKRESRAARQRGLRLRRRPCVGRGSRFSAWGDVTATRAGRRGSRFLPHGSLPDSGSVTVPAARSRGCGPARVSTVPGPGDTR